MKKGATRNLPWVSVDDYKRSTGWVTSDQSGAHSRAYCGMLERGQILFFREPPFDLPAEDQKFLLEQEWSELRMHKNVSYRPSEDMLRGVSGDRETTGRLHSIMRNYAAEVRDFVNVFLAPYAGKWNQDFASFRPLEEEGRDLSLHKRNDLLHVDAFPSRPTRGARILRVFTNVNPVKDRIWVVAERFPELAARYAVAAGLPSYAKASSAWSGLRRGLSRVGLPVPDRAAYDEFMLNFHDWLKENSEFQQAKEGKEQVSFPSMATWLVYTDGVPHAALSGQFAMEQTFIVPVEALVAPEVSRIRVRRKWG